MEKKQKIKEIIAKRNNVTVRGIGPKVLMLAHGFGCDQRIWRFVLPTLELHYTVVLFDYSGSGKSNLSSFSAVKYSSLDGYAQDVIDIIQAFELKNVAFVGHSVSSMIGLIAALKKPEDISEIIMVSPSPRFMSDLPEYKGGFEKSDLDKLISLMDKNSIGWASYLAPLLMGEHTPQELVAELSGSFCSTDPTVAKNFARATFFSDNRELLSLCPSQVLVLQSASDSIAPIEIGNYVHQHVPNSKLEILEAEGHCLHMTHPDLTAKSVMNFVR